MVRPSLAIQPQLVQLIIRSRIKLIAVQCRP
nr:MAG TPA_asm: hypothetical protein [Bacteriophage sp.]